ncbi:MAG: polyphosphate polymerase domain-containing protein [Candidatus Rifleibacteriota bacterium]
MNKAKPYHEIKFPVNTVQLLSLKEKFGRICNPDKNGLSGRYEVLSIYFDSPDLKFYRQKVEGEFNKLKVRLRFYRNDPRTEWKKARLELKTRAGNMVSKHRLESGLLKDCSADNWSKLDLRSVLLNELTDKDNFSEILTTHLKPLIAVFYQRTAYEAKEIFGCRLTFDERIIGFDPARIADFSRDDYGLESVKHPTTSIFEIKSYFEAPECILNQVERLGVARQSYSKYSALLSLSLEKTGMEG